MFIITVVAIHNPKEIIQHLKKQNLNVKLPGNCCYNNNNNNKMHMTTVFMKYIFSVQCCLLSTQKLQGDTAYLIT